MESLSLWTLRGMTEGGLSVCLHVTFKSSWQKGHEECEDMESGGKDMKQVTSMRPVTDIEG